MEGESKRGSGAGVTAGAKGARMLFGRLYDDNGNQPTLKSPPQGFYIHSTYPVDNKKAACLTTTVPHISSASEKQKQRITNCEQQIMHQLINSLASSFLLPAQ